VAISNAPWDGSASRWPDAASYCKSCLIKRQHDGELSKDDCSLPIREPGGDINSNALGPALGALNGARGGLKSVSPADRKAAARKLASAYREAQMDIPDSLKRMIQ
jgi:hypothetical protein